MEDNDEVEDNDRDDNNDKGISALGLDRDLEFSRGHPTKSTLTIPNQTNQTIPNQTIPKQTKPTTPNQTKLAHIHANSRKLAQFRAKRCEAKKLSVDFLRRVT